MTNDEDYNWELDFSVYQDKAAETAVYPESTKRYYPALGLAGEAGEVANKIKKELRDGVPVDNDTIADELGDVLWYVAMIAYDYDIDLSYIANRNLQKLRDRKERGVLGGSGDKR